MARYDVYRAPDDALLLDVQSPLLDIVGSRVVIPLLPAAAAPRSIARLHPVFDVEGEPQVLATHLISAVPDTLVAARVANLAQHHDEIVAALDMLFQGF
ncbi:CcdB family protein [Aliihoeflea sp. 40Bstr573]|uniref:CcdB family protein n=1 Tax=Aliihoeflea sp. 40Bstr573 TaxID=2696467 RepID=UPI002095E072|nr:CcdB family protein [Aliihoeflea sp. 40Bstr573]MCO6386704.1 plasmid maintenance protein CcdB [Aliihoeflea sp. 40Bstr573]